MGAAALAPSLSGLSTDQSGPGTATAGAKGAPGEARGSHEPVDPFMLQGDRNIRDEKHFGIINGLITTGVNYRDLGSLSSLYAPPYASSDFLLEVRLFGEKVPTTQYDWRPAEVRQKGQVSGISLSAAFCLAHDVRGGLLELTVHNRTSATK